MNYPKPSEWVAYLREPGRKKARRQFANKNGGRCCLGHYADMCGLEYKPAQGLFYREGYPHGEAALLPDDHWLFHQVSSPHGNHQWHQEVLATLNDSKRGFDKVIEYIERELVPLAG